MEAKIKLTSNIFDLNGTEVKDPTISKLSIVQENKISQLSRISKTNVNNLRKNNLPKSIKTKQYSIHFSEFSQSIIKCSSSNSLHLCINTNSHCKKDLNSAEVNNIINSCLLKISGSTHKISTTELIEIICILKNLIIDYDLYGKLEDQVSLCFYKFDFIEKLISLLIASNSKQLTYEILSYFLMILNLTVKQETDNSILLKQLKYLLSETYLIKTLCYNVKDYQNNTDLVILCLKLFLLRNIQKSTNTNSEQIVKFMVENKIDLLSYLNNKTFDNLIHFNSLILDFLFTLIIDYNRISRTANLYKNNSYLNSLEEDLIKNWCTTFLLLLNEIKFDHSNNNKTQNNILINSYYKDLNGKLSLFDIFMIMMINLLNEEFENKNLLIFRIFWEVDNNFICILVNSAFSAIDFYNNFNYDNHSLDSNILLRNCHNFLEIIKHIIKDSDITQIHFVEFNRIILSNAFKLLTKKIISSLAINIVDCVRIVINKVLNNNSYDTQDTNNFSNSVTMLNRDSLKMLNDVNIFYIEIIKHYSLLVIDNSHYNMLIDDLFKSVKEGNINAFTIINSIISENSEIFIEIIIKFLKSEDIMRLLRSLNVLAVILNNELFNGNKDAEKKIFESINNSNILDQIDNLFLLNNNDIDFMCNKIIDLIL